MFKNDIFFNTHLTEVISKSLRNFRKKKEKTNNLHVDSLLFNSEHAFSFQAAPLQSLPVMADGSADYATPLQRRAGCC